MERGLDKTVRTDTEPDAPRKSTSDASAGDPAHTCSARGARGGERLRGPAYATASLIGPFPGTLNVGVRREAGLPGRRANSGRAGNAYLGKD